jgi:hypothetical protein
MSHVKSIGLSLIAIFLFGAIASASASAEQCKFESGELFVVCILNAAETELELQSTNTEFEGTQEKEEPHTFTIKFTTPAVVSCSEGKTTATAEPISEGAKLLLMKAKITFTNCEVTSAAAECEVLSTEGKAGEITTEPLDAVPSLAEEEEGTTKVKERLDLTFSPESGTTFATFSLDSKEGKTCVDATSKGKVTGTQLCFFLGTGQSIEEDEEQHLLQCNGPGTLKYAGTESQLVTEFALKLKGSTKKWDIVQGI